MSWQVARKNMAHQPSEAPCVPSTCSSSVPCVTKVVAVVLRVV